MNFKFEFCLLLICLFIQNSLAFDFFNMFNGSGDENFQREEQFVKKGINIFIIKPKTLFFFY